MRHCRTKRMTHFSISGSKKQDRAGMLQRWRCCRTTSPLEGWHLHLRRLTDPTTKGKSGHLCLVRIGLRVFRWNVDAAVRLGFLPDLGHHQLWLPRACYGPSGRWAYPSRATPPPYDRFMPTSRSSWRRRRHSPYKQRRSRPQRDVRPA